MTNYQLNTPLYSPYRWGSPYSNDSIGVYGVRWMGIVTFSGNTHAMTNTSAYLYVDDGSQTNKLMVYSHYLKIKLTAGQNIETSFWPGKSLWNGYSDKTYYRAFEKEKKDWV